MTKIIAYKKYIQEQKNDFSVLEFYQHYEFEGRGRAERAIKNAMRILKKTVDDDDSVLSELIIDIEKDDYESLKEDAIEVYWAKKKCENKILEASHKHIALDSAVSIEMYENALKQLQAKKKRKLN